MKEKDKEATSSGAPKPAAPGVSEWGELARLWRVHGRPLAIGVVIAVLAYGVYRAWRGTRRGAETEASMALLTAQRPEQWEEIVHRFGSTPYGPPALLALASTRYHEGNYAVALSLYEDFLKKHAAHEMAAAAELGRWHAAEELGRRDEALKGFTDFLDAHPGHYLAPLAVFGRARGLARTGRLEEARVVYEDFLATLPEEPWRSQAEMALTALHRFPREVAAAPAP